MFIPSFHFPDEWKNTCHGRRGFHLYLPLLILVGGVLMAFDIPSEQMKAIQISGL